MANDGLVHFDVESARRPRLAIVDRLQSIQLSYAAKNTRVEDRG